MLYDDFLTIQHRENIRIIGFADDIIIIVTARSEELEGNIAIQKITTWLDSKKAKLEPKETEVVLLTTFGVHNRPSRYYIQSRNQVLGSMAG